MNGRTIDNTIRATDCYVLWDSSSSNRTIRYTAHIRYRSQLRVRRHREKCHDEQLNVAHDSHTIATTCAHMPREELMERLKSCQKEKKRLLKSKCDYRDVQIKKLIKKQGVRMIDKDNEDMHRLMNESNWLPMLRMNLTRTPSPQYMPWKEQVN